MQTYKRRTTTVHRRGYYGDIYNAKVKTWKKEEANLMDKFFKALIGVTLSVMVFGFAWAAVAAIETPGIKIAIGGSFMLSLFSAMWMTSKL